jgi:hypothetical protein
MGLDGITQPQIRIFQKKKKILSKYMPEVVEGGVPTLLCMTANAEVICS